MDQRIGRLDSPSVNLHNQSEIEADSLKQAASQTPAASVVPNESAVDNYGAQKALKQQGAEVASMNNLSGQLKLRELESQLKGGSTQLSYQTGKSGQAPLVQGPAQRNAALAKEKEMREAAETGDMKKLQQLINSGVDVNAKDPLTGRTALMGAARNGKLDAIKLLTANKADVNATDVEQRTAMMQAAVGRQPAAIKLLREKGGITDMADISGRTPLIEASINGDLQSMDALLKGRGGADVNIIDKAGRSALIWASEHGDAKVVKKLIDEFADVSGRDNNDRTALMQAAATGRRDSVKILLDKISTYKDDPKLMSMLIDNQDDSGRTALMDAAAKGNIQIVQDLLKHNARTDLVDTNGHSAKAIAQEMMKKATNPADAKKFEDIMKLLP